MTSFGRAHLRRHVRFYAAAFLGLAAWAATAWLDSLLRLALAADLFFGVYLLLTILFVAQTTPASLRKLAALQDEGIVLIVLIAFAAVCFSLASIFMLLAQSERPGPLQLVLTLASAPLGWLTLHTIAAFHYAHVYYTRSGGKDGNRDSGGLKFPGADEPHAWDFLYFAFVVGMTAQVSDVQVLTTPMRKLTLAQGIVSFFFNTVLLALAVNTAVALSSGR